MRILMWVRSAFPYMGGIERIVHDITRSLIARGHQVGTLSGMTPVQGTVHDEKAAGPIWYVDVVKDIVERDVSAMITGTQRILRILREFNPDVIHYHPSGPELLVFNLVRPKIRVPIVTTVHVDLANTEPQERKTFFDTLARSAATIAISKATESGVGQRLPDLRKVHVIPNTVRRDDARFSPPQGRRLLALGRIVPEKGFDLAVHAMPYIVDAVPDAKLSIAGNGPARSALEETVP